MNEETGGWKLDFIIYSGVLWSQNSSYFPHQHGNLLNVWQEVGDSSKKNYPTFLIQTALPPLHW